MTMEGIKRKCAKYTLGELHETIEVIVTENNTTKTFKLFRLLTAQYAPNFAAMFNHPGIESIRFKNVDMDTFEYFSGWLRACYIQDEFSSKDLWGNDDGPEWELLGDEPECYDGQGDPLVWGESQPPREWLLWTPVAIEMFLFAQTYDIPRLRQDALDRLVWCFHPHQYEGSDSPGDWTFLMELVTLAWKHTPPCSPLQRILIDGLCQVALWSDNSFIKYLPREALPQFFTEYEAMIKSPYANDREQRKNGLSACEYHAHKDDADKASCEIRVF